MSNPLSPLSSSFQNARARSPKTGSSPFLTKTLDEPKAPDALPSSPLKQVWTDREAQSPNPSLSYTTENYNTHDMIDENENDDLNDDDDFQDAEAEPEPEPASSPFRFEARDDTVDFQKMQEYQQQQKPRMTPKPAMTPRRRFEVAEPEDPMSSPFRADARDETVDFQRLREVQPLSPGLDRRLDVEVPASSPFRADTTDETVDFQRLSGVQPMSPGLDKRLEVDNPESSPFRPDARDETVDFQKLRELQQPLSPVIPEQPDQPKSSPFRPNVHEYVPEEDGFESNELVEAPPSSIGRDKHSPPPVAHSSSLRTEVNEDVPEDIPAEVDTQDLVQGFGQSIGRLKHSPPPVEPSSPFRPEVHEDIPANVREEEENIEAQEVQEAPLQSIGHVNHSPLPVADGSPLQSNEQEDKVDSEEMHKTPGTSIDRVKHSSPIPIRKSPLRQSTQEESISVSKFRSSRRSMPRTSLGLDGASIAATPRKRSYDQTPQGLEEGTKPQEPCKKGMTSRPEGPEIHVDLDEGSSVINNESELSITSAIKDRSTIGNSMMEDKRNEGMSTVLHDEDNSGSDENSGLGEDYNDSMDDTGLSTFSVLPDMTSFAKLRAESPLKSMRGSVGPDSAHRGDMYRRSADPSTPGTARRSYRASALLDTGSPVGSPTPRRRTSRDIGNPRETPNLLDFTDSMNFFPHQSAQQGGRYSPARRSPMRPMRQSIKSPSKFSSLLDLDFEMAPAPTPRSLPSITPRELESLKSGFMSEISSLKATLSGKDAEVASLKTAIADAERRVGEALEEVRNEAARRETLEMEQAEWDRRGNEMESVLRTVRSDLVEGERERERLTRKAEEAEKSKEQLEGRIVELESQLSAARKAATSDNGSASSSRQASQSTQDTAREVQEAVEKVARELHTLYKGKHETKVAALKKSYESRWEKRLREAEKKLAAANEENVRLRDERDSAQSDNAAAANASMIARENDDHEAEKRVFEARIQGLQHEMASLKEDSDRLRSELKSERAEKGELVAAVDEWLAMQQSQPGPAPAQDTREMSVSSAGPAEEEYLSAGEQTENLRRSVRSGSSGIRPPATGEKRKLPRFGAPGGHSRGNSGGKSGIAVFTPGRGGIMSSIERMGRGGV
ncbi:Central kinetochore-associated [Penicillium argentinense]|uniref:Central kinetochore-associated n=1 Tax=Penicillium argentinense TaxID=1131581 RepID=A0A9W9JUJ1_9EURO|nr:Central kinetochore-associated [Penicillium argentinense]KAJ5081991.1 Central kinetochore-associated [Penicillium argentinense]